MVLNKGYAILFQVLEVSKGNFLSMRLRLFTQWKNIFSHMFLLKIGATLSLFLVSVLIVACGTSATASTANPGDPPVTVTIDLNSSHGSPTPTLPEYWCGAWATQSSPPLGTNTVGVYAKFVHNVKTNPNDPNDVGNPQGIEGAAAIATVLWPDGTQAQVAGTTGADGLASFPISTANRGDAVNKLTFITVQFTKDGVPPCAVDRTRAAFFTLVIATPGASGSPGATPTGGITGTPSGTGTPVGTPKPGPTGVPSVTPIPKPTGTPGKH